MKVVRRVLEKYVDLNGLDSQFIADKMTDSGIETILISPNLKSDLVVVGEVVSCLNHPDSDHLHLCRVNVGSEVLQIVCGAKNVCENAKVVVALVGAKLPEITIKEAKIRGVESFGMLCSYQELGVEKESDGIIILDSDCEVGINALSVLGLLDDVFNFEQTPNRSDFLALYNIAYEMSAVFKRDVKFSLVDSFKGNFDSDFSVKSKTELCSYFSLVEARNLVVKESPQWIKDVLLGCGMHPINNIVDISNLVMLETGQPNHIYDLDCLNDKHIEIIDDYDGEVVALDGLVHQIKPGMIIIHDSKNPMGIGGVKGLSNSMISSSTKNVLVEMAHFDRVSVRNTARSLNIVSESALRFSKPLDSQAAVYGLNRLLSLLVEYADLKVSDISNSVTDSSENEFEAKRIEISLADINHLLGTDFSLDEVIDVFERLRLVPELNDEIIRVKVPSYRLDLEIKEDLIEEVIRILGYDQIKATYPVMPLTMGVLDNKQKLTRQVEKLLCALGLNQVVSYTLVAKEFMDQGLSLASKLNIISPLSEARAYIRNNLVSSGLEVLKSNLAFKNNDQVYFEISNVYGDDEVKNHLVIFGSGLANSINYLSSPKYVDYFWVKGILELLLKDLGINSQRLKFSENDLDINNFHPYQSALVYLDNKLLGVLGTIHPNLKIKNGVLLELDLDLLLAAKKSKTKFEALSSQADLVRDMTFELALDMNIGPIINTIYQVAKKQIIDVNLVDVFESDNTKAISLRVTFKYNPEVNVLFEKVINDVVKKHNVKLKGSL